MEIGEDKDTRSAEAGGNRPVGCKSAVRSVVEFEGTLVTVQSAMIRCLQWKD